MDYLTINSQLGFRLTEIMVKLKLLFRARIRAYTAVGINFSSTIELKNICDQFQLFL